MTNYLIFLFSSDPYFLCHLYPSLHTTPPPPQTHNFTRLATLLLFLNTMQLPVSNLPKHQLALISNISKDILIITTLSYKLIKIQNFVDKLFTQKSKQFSRNQISSYQTVLTFNFECVLLAVSANMVNDNYSQTLI